MADDKLRIVVNVQGMTWDDMRLLLKVGENPEDLGTFIDIFDRFIEGGAAAVPIENTQEVVAALIEAIGAMTNSKNFGSGSPPTSGQAKKRQRNTSS